MTPRERPILFSGEMIRAILDGRKTMTRRVVRLQPASHLMPGEWIQPPCPYGSRTGRLWVRETFKLAREGNDGKARPLYRADWEIGEMMLTGADAVSPWRPSIHMPRWASRIDLEVTAVRVERVQEIRNEDIAREGCDGFRFGELAFVALWDQINDKRPGCSWADNPWAWVVSFRQVRP